MVWGRHAAAVTFTPGRASGWGGAEKREGLMDLARKDSLRMARGGDNCREEQLRYSHPLLRE